MKPTLGVLTVSDRSSRGLRPDKSGPLVAEIAQARGFRLKVKDIVPDDSILIRSRLRRWADHLKLDLILTTGGTGIGPRDVTPESTRPLLDQEMPGIPEAMRFLGARHTPLSWLSRAAAGVRKKTLIVNLPGSPDAIFESLPPLLPILQHALEMKDGKDRHDLP